MMSIKSFRPAAALLLASLIISLSTPAQISVKPSRDEQDLTALVKQMTAAQAGFDSAALEKIYASDYIEISPVGEVDPREKAIGFYKSPADSNSGSAAPTVASDEFIVRTYGQFAIVIARVGFVQTGSEAAARPPVNFRVAFGCRKEKGVWKIASAQWTAIRPARPPAVK